jgi:hypothetical protein
MITQLKLVLQLFAAFSVVFAQDKMVVKGQDINSKNNKGIDNVNIKVNQRDIVVKSDKA